MIESEYGNSSSPAKKMFTEVVTNDQRQRATEVLIKLKGGKNRSLSPSHEYASSDQSKLV